MKPNWSDLPGILGVALIVGGMAHFSVAISGIVLGLMMVGYSYKFGK